MVAVNDRGPPDGDRAAVGVAREIGEHRLCTSERRLGIDRRKRSPAPLGALGGSSPEAAARPRRAEQDGKTARIRYATLAGKISPVERMGEEKKAQRCDHAVHGRRGNNHVALFDLEPLDVLSNRGVGRRPRNAAKRVTSRIPRGFTSRPSHDQLLALIVSAQR